MIPRVDVTVMPPGFEPLVQRLERMRRMPELASLVLAVRATVDDRFRDIYPTLVKSGRLKNSLTRAGSTGAYANLARRRDEGSVEVGSLVNYASAQNVWPTLHAEVIGERALGSAPDAWAALVLEKVVED